jgi:hypothetical protein
MILLETTWRDDVCRDDDRLRFRFKNAVLSGSETPQSLGMAHGDVISVQRYILVDVTPKHYRFSSGEATRVSFQIGLHTKLGKFMDAYREHQGTEAAG